MEPSFCNPKWVALSESDLPGGNLRYALFESRELDKKEGNMYIGNITYLT